MSSPLPPDPYTALGVPKDADAAQIRTAHRKLVLKYHPDRIKGDDAEEKDRAKNEFQKVQQAYELLLDPSRRSRYDDQVKLAELQRERMLREPPRTTTYNPKSHYMSSSVRTETRSDGIRVEERAPPTSYFEDQDGFDEPIPTRPARKYETPVEKDRKPASTRPVEKREKASSKLHSPVEGISFKTAMNLKAHAAKAKERARENAKSQESRDREKRRDRSEKHHTRRAYAEVESDSGSDTVVQKDSARSTRSSPRPKQEPEFRRVRPGAAMRSVYRDDESFSEEDEKWERHFQVGKEYIYESQSQRRPGPTRTDTDPYEGHTYWAKDHGTRRSGSDSEKQPRSRRTKPEESRSRPSMPVHSSAPSNLKPHVEERAPQRARTTPYPERERERERDQRPAPSLARSQTMPTNKTVRRDTAPTKSSGLKNETTPQDSGYYSSSNPHTPEMPVESPLPSRENSKKKSSGSTKYTIVTPEDEDDRASHIGMILPSDDEGRRRRVRSPEPDRRDRDRDRDRDRMRERERDRERDRDRDRDRERPRERERPNRTESDSRVRPSKPAPVSYNRSDFRSEATRATPPVSRPKLFGEVNSYSYSSDEKDAPSYSYQYDRDNVKTASYRKPAMSAYPPPRNRDDSDFATGSTFRAEIRNPYSRRPSAAY